jgi:hypothetical protein
MVLLHIFLNKNHDHKYLFRFFLLTLKLYYYFQDFLNIFKLKKFFIKITILSENLNLYYRNSNYEKYYIKSFLNKYYKII